MKFKKLDYRSLRKGDSLLILHRDKKPSLGRIAGLYPTDEALSVDIQYGPNLTDWYNRRIGLKELPHLLVFQGQTIMAGEKAYSFLDRRSYKRGKPSKSTLARRRRLAEDEAFADYESERTRNWLADHD